MRLAVVKPDHGVAGGFEGVIARLVTGLRARGHVVDLVQLSVSREDVSRLAVPVSAVQLALFRDFFVHLNTIRRFEQLDLSGYDAVLCTQPGSYAVPHPRKVVLFYHHLRTFYDLQEVIESARRHDVALHQLAAFIVRDIDGFFLTPDVPILAGSRRVKERLADHNGLRDNVSIFDAGLDEAFLTFDGPVTFEAPLSVGRHEFPKRTELFLHAMLHVDRLEGRVVGEGSLTRRLQGLDAWLRLQHPDPAPVASGPSRTDPAAAASGLSRTDPAAVVSGFSRTTCPIDDDRFWRDLALHLPDDELRAAEEAASELPSRVRFLGRASQEQLLAEYAAALCVVCPAYDEDFGLTCLEAMACGKPVIACRDGGGYVELVEDGVDGFLVEPTGRAIAAAIERLRDVALARTMGERGREKARAFTWTRAIDQVERALDALTAGSRRS
jgi:glycosyltransferase involved in cell wall biosynthesis